MKGIISPHLYRGQKDVTKWDVFVGFDCQTINWKLDVVNTNQRYDWLWIQLPSFEFELQWTNDSSQFLCPIHKLSSHSYQPKNLYTLQYKEEL